MRVRSGRFEKSRSGAFPASLARASATGRAVTTLVHRLGEVGLTSIGGTFIAVSLLVIVLARVWW